MENLRRYGNPPYTVAVIHGGPGAPGEMAPIARELASDWGVLEPLQTKATLPEQITELKEVLGEYGDLPITLAGFSWGAWLCYLFAAQYPEMVNKLILISSGSFEKKYISDMQEIRMGRLSIEERKEVEHLMDILNNPSAEDKNSVFARFGELFSQADAFDPISLESEVIECQYDIFQSVWQEAEKLRRSGELLQLGREITCPVTAIHGDYDSHPAEGVQQPLSSVLKNFHFILLRNCGHKPWIERKALDEFWQVLRKELDLKFI